MTRLLILVLGLTLACGKSNTVSDAAASDTDSDVGDAGIDPTPSVTAELLVGIGGDSRPLTPPLAHFRTMAGPELVFGFGATSIRQPVGPEQLALEANRVIAGWNEGPGTPFEWLSYDQGPIVRWVGDDASSVWLHYPTAEPHWLGEDEVTGPAIAIWSRDGSTDRRSVPAGLELRYLGTDAEGTPWVIGWGEGSTVVDGSPLGADGTEVLFVAAMASELVSPQILATITDAVDDPPTNVELLPGGEVLLMLAVPEGAVLGESVTDYRRLLRVDPSTGLATGTWELPQTAVLPREDGRIELITSVTETTTVGSQTYEAFPPNGERVDPETWIRVVWDGAGDEIPAGERLAIHPAELKEAGGVRVTKTWQLVAQLDDDGSIRRWISVDNGLLMGATPFEGRIWAQVMSDGSGIVSLRLLERDGSTTAVPLEAERPEASFWLLEIDPESGAILRQKAFDVGLEERSLGDRRDGYARPLPNGYFFVATRPAGQPLADLRVDGWGLDAPVPIVPTITGTGCQMSSRHSELDRRIAYELDPSSVRLHVLCDAGPHRIELGGTGFDYAATASATLVRLTIE